MTQVLAHELMTLGTETPRLRVDWTDRPKRYLTIDGRPAYQIAYSCGTCGLVLRREPGTTPGRPPAEQVRDRLNAGLDALDSEVVGAFSAQLPYGDYLVMLLDVRPSLVMPGSAEDYFAAEGPDAWQNEEFECPLDPANSAYYRLGRDHVDEHDELFQFAVPITDPAQADPATTARYAGAVDSHPTAVAFGLLDIHRPWFRSERHWGLFHYLLDGHHKTAAAVGRTIRLLTFISAAESFATEAEVLRLADTLLAGNGARRE
ncbi:hypothetical protein [Microtetraspora glauca]|uniref:Uncharacterized protein n=1 Tax=Microtetraspora glauca TaxID=1996 RepID=A0ABV3GAH5_MICGL